MRYMRYMRYTCAMRYTTVAPRFGRRRGGFEPRRRAQKYAPKDRIWHTKRRRLRVFDRLRTSPAGQRMFGVAASGAWSGCWAQTSRFGVSRFVPKIAKNSRNLGPPWRTIVLP